jgi:hypothetical protein
MPHSTRYASLGDVEYSVGGFVAKNKDSLSPDMQGMVRASENEFLVALFVEQQQEDDAYEAMRGGGGGGGSSAGEEGGGGGGGRAGRGGGRGGRVAKKKPQVLL